VYTFNEIREITLEISSYCQAKCPMCSRNYHGHLPNPKLIEKNMSLATYKKLLTPNVITSINTISMSGNFGDPIINNDLLNMIEYSVKINPCIYLDIYTNGGIRNVQWWKKLAKVLPKKHLVRFGLDGLEDTHSLYRINTDYNKIIKNATEFINAGGRAQWVFIEFKHNEHQLDQARQLSKDLGFESFQEKQTNRFYGNPWHNVYDKEGNTIYKLEQPSDKKINFISKDKMINFKKLLVNTTISCEAKNNKRIFIDSTGMIWPCSYMSSGPYLYSTPDEYVYNYHQENAASINNVLSKFNKSLNIIDRQSLGEVVDSDEWQTIWEESFKKYPTLTCSKLCGNIGVPTSEDQILKEEKFL